MITVVLRVIFIWKTQVKRERAMLVRVCLVVIVTCAISQAAAIDGQSGKMLSQVLLAINATVNYLVTHPKTHSSIMLNMIIVEGQLTNLLRRLHKENSVDKYLMDIMEEIVDALQHDNNAIKAVNAHGLINGKNNWDFAYPSRVTDDAMAYGWMDREVVSEKISEHCMSQINSVNGHEACAVTKFCWKYMTAANKSIDYLTQQLFYLSVADNNGCEEVMTSLAESNGQTSLQHIYERICSTIRPTLMSNMDSKVWQDQIYIQMLYCGILGFKDIFTSSSKRVDYLMSLQRQDGCISNVPQRPSTGFSWTSLMKLIGLAPSEGECYPTRSSLAAALFTQYIRFLVEDPELVGYRR